MLQPWLLNKLVERLVIQQRNIRVLLEFAPNGFVLVEKKWHHQAGECERGEAIWLQSRGVSWAACRKSFGTVRTEYRPDGLFYEIRVDLSEIDTPRAAIGKQVSTC